MRLGYYTSRFPFPQGPSAGPYPAFLARPRTALVMVETTGSLRTARSPHAARAWTQRQSFTAKCGACPHHEKCRTGRPTPCNLRGLGQDSSAGLPAGSSLVYSATWNASTLRLMTASAVASGIQAAAAAQGINFTVASAASILASTTSFTLNVTTTQDRNAAADVKAVLDNLIYQSVGVMPQSSISLSSIAVPTAAVVSQYAANYQAAIDAGDSASAQYWLSLLQSAGGTTSSSLLTWAQANPLYVAGGLLALVFVWRMA